MKYCRNTYKAELIEGIETIQFKKNHYDDVGREGT
jgi:hypothetical protein